MTAILDLNSASTLNVLAPPAARTTTGTGTAVDVRGQKGVAAVVLTSAAGTGTAPTLNVTIQDSEDGSTGWANVPGAAFAQVTTASSQKIGLDLDSTRGFIRASWTVAGTTPSFNFACTALGRSF